MFSILFDYSRAWHCIGLVFYEFLLTWDAEVRLFWGREVTGASVIFFANRYTMFFFALLSLVQISPLAGSASVSPSISPLFGHQWYSKTPQAYV